MIPAISRVAGAEIRAGEILGVLVLSSGATTVAATTATGSLRLVAGLAGVAGAGLVRLLARSDRPQAPVRPPHPCRTHRRGPVHARPTACTRVSP